MQVNLQIHAAKMVERTARAADKKLQSTANFDVGDVVHLLAPGDPRNMRNPLKPRHSREPRALSLSCSTLLLLSDRGLWGVTVRITATGVRQSDFVYEVAGWNGERPGFAEKAENYRLAKWPSFKAWDGDLPSAVSDFFFYHRDTLSRFVLDGIEHQLSLALGFKGPSSSQLYSA